MPRRESYRTDDEDDDLRRRASASGGGLPAWVWLVGGGGVLAVVVVAGLGFALFTGRQAAMRQDFAQAQAVRVEADRRAMAHDHGDGDEPEAGAGAVVVPNIHQKGTQILSLARLVNAYRNDPAAADANYTGRRLLVRFEVGAVGDGWVGASGPLEKDRPATTTNVVFQVPAGAGGVAVGSRVVIEAECAGLAPDAETGVKLTFADGRFVER